MSSTSTSVDSKLDTIPKLLLRNAKIYGARPAFREKALGIWQTWSWAQVLEEVRPFALGLKMLGLKRGDTIAIIGDNRPRLYWTFLAAQSLGALPVPAYQDSVAEELVFVLKHAGIKFVVAENQEQVDKVLQIADQVPSIEQIIYDESRGLANYGVHGHIRSFEDIQAIGMDLLGDTRDAGQDWLDQIQKGQGSEPSVLLYTSGTTGQSKGVILTAGRCIAAAEDTVAFDRLNQYDEALAYLPLAWVGDHYLNFVQGMVAGFCLSCPESPETVQENLREIGSTFYFALPRVFEGMLTQVTIRMEDAGWFKRWLFRHFMNVAKRYGEAILDRRWINPIGRMRYALGNVLLYAPLKNRLGFSRIRVAYTAGEAIGPDLFSFYRSLGLNLKQLYGQTEAFLYVTCQRDGEIRRQNHRELEDNRCIRLHVVDTQRRRHGEEHRNAGTEKH